MVLTTLALWLVAGCHAPAASAGASHRATSAPPRKSEPALEVLPIAAAAARAEDPAAVPLAPVESVPFTIPLPANVACKLEDATKSPPSVELGLSREGPSFGVMRSRSLVARIGVDEREMVVDAEGPGLRLRAIAIEGSLDLYATAATVFEDMFVPQSFAELGVVAGTTGGIETSLVLPKQITMPKRKAVTARVPCASLSLQQARFDAEDALGPGIAVAYLVPDATALAATAGGKAVAMLHPRGSSLEVKVLAREGRYTKIAWDVEAVIAFGWVDKSRLRPAPSGADEFAAGGLGLSGIGEGNRRTLSCEGEVPLRAQVGTRTEIVGVILPRTAIEILAERPYAYEVELPTTGLEKDEKAVLLVDKEQVASCSG